jgi:6-phosphogluconolactonase
MTQTVRWHVFPDAAVLCAHATDAILESARQAITARGAFRIVLAGGQTPMDVYARLREAPAEWGRWHVYFGDERCLPAGDPGRNDFSIRRAWLDRVAIPPGQIHAIAAERGDEISASRYAQTLRNVGEFDLVLLGLGEDGHTASLFPGHPLGNCPGDPDVLAVRDAPKPPPERVSLGAARLSRSRQVLFLVSGASKRHALLAWQRGDKIPARYIEPSAGVDVFLDAHAADTRGMS